MLVNKGLNDVGSSHKSWLLNMVFLKKIKKETGEEKILLRKKFSKSKLQDFKMRYLNDNKS